MSELLSLKNATQEELEMGVKIAKKAYRKGILRNEFAFTILCLAEARLEVYKELQEEKKETKK